MDCSGQVSTVPSALLHRVMVRLQSLSDALLSYFLDLETRLSIMDATLAYTSAPRFLLLICG